MKMYQWEPVIITLFEKGEPVTAVYNVNVHVSLDATGAVILVLVGMMFAVVILSALLKLRETRMKK
jgi:hypothetical protein